MTTIRTYKTATGTAFKRQRCAKAINLSVYAVAQLAMHPRETLTHTHDCGAQQAVRKAGRDSYAVTAITPAKETA